MFLGTYIDLYEPLREREHSRRLAWQVLQRSGRCWRYWVISGFPMERLNHLQELHILPEYRGSTGSKRRHGDRNALLSLG